MSDTPTITFLLGCTGSGKGAVGRELARRVGGEIISVDSMKVYRRMDIGTAKPSAEIQKAIKHHLIDVVEPSESFSVAQFVELAEAAAADIARRGKPILAVGGTPLYIKALSEGLFEGPSADPQLRAALHERAAIKGSAALHAELAEVDPTTAERVHRNDLRRIVRALEVFRSTGRSISSLQTQWDRPETRRRCEFIGLRRGLEDQNARINARVRRMIELGLVEEVRRLLDEKPPLADAPRGALGYAESIEYLAGRMSLENAVERTKINTRQLAKSQRTWYRRFPAVHWIDVQPDESVESVADRVMALNLLK